MINKIAEPTIGDILARLESRLVKTSSSPALDAQILVAHLLGQPRSWVLAHPELLLSGGESGELEKSVSQLEAGKPLPYILGHWEFYGLDFDLTPDVLIPRPETELLVERALAWLRDRPDCRTVADIGTGSGSIGISLAVNIPDLKVEAVDISPAAIRMAKLNATRHGVIDRMEFSCTDLLSGRSSFDLIAANLPYIPTRALHSLKVFGHEPNLALDGGTDGMDLIRRLLTAAPDHLHSGGLLLMELEATEGLAALSFAYDMFSKARIHLHKDLSGHDRLLEIQV
jgi:release factor glutamine methyltransferase